MMTNFPLTAEGNALRMSSLYEADLRYVEQWKRWFVWDDDEACWCANYEGCAVRAVNDTIARLYAESPPGSTARKWALRSESAGIIFRSAKLARKELLVAAPPPAPNQKRGLAMQKGNAFVGWHRPNRRSPWVQLATGPTFGDCWGALLDRLPLTQNGSESIVLVEGTHPAETAAWRQEKR